MASTTVSGSGTRNNSGVALGINTSTSVVTALTLRNSCANSSLIGTEATINSGVQSVTLGSAVTIAAITQSGSTGKVNIQKSSHGKSVGDKVIVSGSDTKAYNVSHTITVITDANNFKTNINYSVDTTTHGSYYAPTGSFAKVTAGKYVARVVCTELAGVANTTLRGGYVGAGSSAFAFARGSRRYNITSWNYVTGAATHGANQGDLVKYHDISGNVDTLAVESFPSRSVPGRITINSGAPNPAVKTTPAITE